MPITNIRPGEPVRVASRGVTPAEFDPIADLATATSAEVVAARSGEISLDARIDSIAAGIGSGDAALDARLDSVEAEITTARSGEASLDARIDAVNQARADNDLILADDIADEASARVAGDNALQAQIDTTNAEIVAARSGEASLDARIDSVNNARAAGDDALDLRLDSVELEITTARDGAPSLDARLDTMATQLGTVATEVATARSGEASLDARIDSVAASVTTGDNALDARLDTAEAKLATIEPNADVTDLANVGAAINSAASQPAIEDGDLFPFLEVSAGNILRKATWANIKTVLVGIYNGLYVPLSRTISTVGLITGGGDLSTNRAFQVAEASSPDMAAGTTVATTVVTPRRFDARVGALEALWALWLPVHAYGRSFVSTEASLTTDRRAVEVSTRRTSVGSLGELYTAFDHGEFRWGTKKRMHEARNIAYVRGVMEQVQSWLAYLVPGINSVNELGQSNGRGSQGFFARNKVPIGGNLMLGNDYRSGSGSDYTVPGGVANFFPLIGQAVGGAGVLTEAEERALAPMAGNSGEPFGVGACNYLRQLTDRRKGIPIGSGADKILYMNGAREATSYDERKKGHGSAGTIEIYNYYLHGIEAAKAAAAAHAHPAFQVHSLIDVGGENEYGQATYVTSRDELSYRNMVSSYHDTAIADALANSTLADPKPPGVYMILVGEKYTADKDGYLNPTLFVANALLDYHRERRGRYLVGPYSHLTDKGGQHRDANGYLWGGLKIGQVMHRVQGQGLGWEPFSPIETSVDGRYLWIDFAVPVPPIRYGTSWREGAGQDYANTFGFNIIDSIGALTIRHVTIFPTQVRMLLNRVPLWDGLVYYAPHDTYLGHGNMRDSDRTIPENWKYTYQPANGDAASVNIPALVDQPYDMSNWLVPFCRPVRWSIFQ